MTSTISAPRYGPHSDPSRSTPWHTFVFSPPRMEENENRRSSYRRILCGGQRAKEFIASRARAPSQAYLASGAFSGAFSAAAAGGVLPAAERKGQRSRRPHSTRGSSPTTGCGRPGPATARATRKPRTSQRASWGGATPTHPEGGGVDRSLCSGSSHRQHPAIPPQRRRHAPARSSPACRRARRSSAGCATATRRASRLGSRHPDSELCLDPYAPRNFGRISKIRVKDRSLATEAWIARRRFEAGAG